MKLYLLMALITAICMLSDNRSKVEAKQEPFNPTINEDGEGLYEDEHVFGGLQSHKPGLKVRLAQNLSEMIKKNIAVYGREYLNFDYKIPTMGVKKIRTFPFYMDVHYHDLHHDPISIDMENFAFNFTNMIIDGEPVVYLAIPMIEEWNITFSYKYKWMGMIPTSGTIKLGFRDVNALTSLKLKATQHGHLYPQLHDLVLDFGKSQLYEESNWNEFWHRQWFDLGKFILQSAYNLFGEKFINQRLFEYSRQTLSDQILDFPLTIPQLDKTGDFSLNWRMTADPKIHDHLLDLAFFMDIGPDGSHCVEPMDQHDYYFQDFDAQYIQFILSDRVPNCMMSAMQRLNWLKYTINTEYLIKHFGSHWMKINAGLFVMLYPSIAQEYGVDQELEISLNVKNPHFVFGEDSNDLSFSAEIDVGLKLLGSMNYLIYDEVQFKCAGDFAIDNEVIVGNLKSMEWLKGGYDQTREMPVFHDDDIQINAQNYQVFWNFLDNYTDQYKDWMNQSVLASGIPLPYWNLEFLTHTTFHQHAVIVVMDLFYNDGDLIDQHPDY